MLTSDKEVVQLIVDQCKLHNVKTLVFSPGSRNSPLAIAFDEDKFFRTFVIHDERSAAFFALGIAQEKKELVAICCTSGSALLNYYPAVAEAFYRNIPLLVISADRPSTWIDQGDGQTIRQQKVFELHSHGFLQLEDAVLDTEKLWYYQRETSILFNKLKRGPFHLNVALREPLYSTVVKSKEYGRKISFFTSNNKISTIDIDVIKDKLKSKKIMVICGQMHENPLLLSKLIDFSINTGAIVLAEHTSNLHDERFISCIDRTLNGIDSKTAYEPEVLVHVGDAIVSKRIKSFLREIPNLEVIRISNETNPQDTFQHLSLHISIEPVDFFDQFKNYETTNTSNFYGKWKQIDVQAKDKIDSITSSLKGLNDWYSFYLIHQYLKENTVVHLGNSSVVRYAQLFDMVKGCLYYANRGTSGIDGSFSTAVGSAVASPDKHHLFISGDISFIYDHNALWIENFPSNLRVIILNNSGGGIFRIIEGSKDSEKNSRYFEASHQQLAAPIISGFSKSVQQLTNVSNLDIHLSTFLTFEETSCQFLEIITESDSNAPILSNFFKLLK
jgi:2-succinyl-5-enolpyruvyl-6-hydroxy-3-cyclohexene-1-carboxylate synthase